MEVNMQNREDTQFLNHKIRMKGINEVKFIHDVLARVVEDYIQDKISKEFNLTEREVELTTMATYGHTNTKIADSLGIQVKTVKFHFTNIMRKFRDKNFKNITNRGSLIYLIMSRLIIDNYKTMGMYISRISTQEETDLLQKLSEERGMGGLPVGKPL